MMGEEVFQLHIATPTYVILPDSLLETSLTWSSFPADALQISYFSFAVATSRMATTH